MTKNPIGVPDILATRDSRSSGFALEAKTSEDGRIALHERELQGLLDTGLTPTVAVLSFPDREPHWIFVDARTLTSATYELNRLARKPRVDLGFDVNLVFRMILAERIEAALERPESLDALLHHERA